MEAQAEQAPVQGEQLQLDGTPEKQKSAQIVRMHEKVERPEMLIGSTYKIKTPVSEHAFYITINDIVNSEFCHSLPPCNVFVIT